MAAVTGGWGGAKCTVAVGTLRSRTSGAPSSTGIAAQPEPFYCDICTSTCGMSTRCPIPAPSLGHYLSGFGKGECLSFLPFFYLGCLKFSIRWCVMWRVMWFCTVLTFFLVYSWMPLLSPNVRTLFIRFPTLSFETGILQCCRFLWCRTQMGCH